MQITSGFELTTALTNVIIFVVSLYGFIKIKNKKLWRFFYLLMTIDSFLGVVVHGIVMSQELNDILWVILAFLFTVTVNTFLCLFLRLKTYHVFILSFLLMILLYIQMIKDFNFLLTFTYYVLLIVLISTYCILKNKNENYMWFIVGIVFLIIGGVLMLGKCSISVINHNGLCHIFMAITLALFYIGLNKDIKEKQ